jgi:hypothetical protein
MKLEACQPISLLNLLAISILITAHLISVGIGETACEARIRKGNHENASEHCE